MIFLKYLISSLEKYVLDCCFGQGFQLGQNLIVVVFNHLILGLLLSNSSLNVRYPHLKHLIVESLSFRILVIFEPLNVQIYTVLRLNELDIPSAQINVCLFVNDFCFFQQNLAVLLLDVYISDSHLFVKIFNFILYLKDLLLIFLLLFKASHHKVSQLLLKILTFFLLSFDSSLSFPNKIL